MKKHPPIELGSEIYVEKCRCIVSSIYEENSSFGVCIVVFNEDKPTSHDVDWDDEKWLFPKRGDNGGYVRLSNKYAQILMRK